MLSLKATRLPAMKPELRQELLALAFSTAKDDSIRGIYEQARCLCHGKPVTAEQLRRLKERIR